MKKLSMEKKIERFSKVYFFTPKQGMFISSVFIVIILISQWILDFKFEAIPMLMGMLYGSIISYLLDKFGLVKK